MFQWWPLLLSLLSISFFSGTSFIGAVSTINSLGGWQYDRNTFEVNGMAEFIITPRDMFGNEIFRSNSHSCSCNFSAQIFTKQSSAPIPVRDMLIVAMPNSNIEKQKLTFSLQKPGEYWLQVGNVLVNILGSPFSFSYVTGQCVHFNMTLMI